MCRFGVPYSEHSSFPELRALLTYLRPRRIIPTVGNSSGAKVAALNALFADLLPSAGAGSASSAHSHAHHGGAESQNQRPAAATAAAAVNVLRAPAVAFSAPLIDQARSLTLQLD
jgi:hypothetical protein